MMKNEVQGFVLRLGDMILVKDQRKIRQELIYIIYISRCQYIVGWKKFLIIYINLFSYFLFSFKFKSLIYIFLFLLLCDFNFFFLLVYRDIIVFGCFK